MPGTKSRTKRRKKRWARGPAAKKSPDVVSSPRNIAVSPTSTTEAPTAAVLTATTTPSGSTESPTSSVATASLKKLSASKYASFDGDSSSESEFERDNILEGQGIRVFELEGLKTVFGQLRCGECGEKSVTYKEDFTKRQALFTAPYLICQSCNDTVSIPFSSVGSSKVLTINRKAVFANKCVGGTAASLQLFCSMLDMPLPISKNVYTTHIEAILAQAMLQVEQSMTQAREEVRMLYGAEGDDTVDTLVSCDGTWQRRGFSSLFGATFVIAYDTGKVIDFRVKSKFCKGCKHWERQDQTSVAYTTWKASHKCDVNFAGSAGAMEPQGILEMLQSSTSYRLRYKWLISDGDAKTHSLILREQPYGTDHTVEKMDCRSCSEENGHCPTQSKAGAQGRKVG